MTAPLRVLIVDDEALARENLRLMLAAHSACEICGECATAAKAAALIASEHPDLVFLDIEMPGVSGVHLAHSLNGPEAPLVIFVTAHASHALRAFDVGAVDYLLKPFDEARLARALERAMQRTGRREYHQLSHRLEALARQLDGTPAPNPRITIREDARMHFLDASEVSRIEADGNRVRFHTASGCYHTRRALDAVERELPPEQFVRVHRSCIVNVAHIRELQPAMHGDYVLRLRDGTRVRLSRRRREAIARLLPSSERLP